ncbi:MAG: LysR family transcriptional regulator [Gammaproteobacteria bacterium]|nr:LysR family transcriptional regulator [Gammaproteobacteria bacterium]
MEFNSLKAFIAVAESGSFTAASERLFLTQPAISKRIAALEEELGASLFDRIGRATTLTEAGQTLLPRARRILDEVQESRRAITNLSGEIGGELSFGTSHHIGLHRLPPILRAFNQAHPQVELGIHFYDSEEACREVGHGNLALALITLPGRLEGPLEQLVVWDDPLAVIVAHGHPLAGGRATLGALVEYPAIFPAKNTYTRQLIDQALQQHGVSAQVRLATNYLETIKMMVSVGLGWSILPRSMVDRDVTEVTVKGLALSRQLGVVTHRQRSLTNAAQAFIALLREGTT